MRMSASYRESVRWQGWQAVDELNRAFAGEAPSGYVAPVHIIFTDNIVQERILQDGIFEPNNNYREQYQRIWLGQK